MNLNIILQPFNKKNVIKVYPFDLIIRFQEQEFIIGFHLLQSFIFKLNKPYSFVHCSKELLIAEGFQ